jgi:uncharacterized protein (TIGR03435 family)
MRSGHRHRIARIDDERNVLLYTHKEREVTLNFKSICVCVLLAAVACIATPTSAQTVTPQTALLTPDDPMFAAFRYDVVSIKPHKDDPKATSHWMGLQDSPDGVTMRNVGVVFFVGQAYRTEHFKVTGAPDWATQEMYDVEAKMDPEVADAFQKLSTPEKKLARQHMMQIFVREYLKAAVHMETTEVSVYDLVIAKNGPKLTEVTDPTIPDRGFTGSSIQGGMQLVAQAMQLATMMGQLSYVSGRPVYDKTGLTGRYNFTLRYSQDNNMSASAPGMATETAPPVDVAPPLARALEEQLGLKLVSSKGNMDVIVIDHVERPAAN